MKNESVKPIKISERGDILEQKSRDLKTADVLIVTVRGYYSQLKRLYTEDDSPKIKIKKQFEKYLLKAIAYLSAENYQQS